MKRAFVAGWPISHSLSPVLHGFWLEEYGIEGSYEALPVETSDFENFLRTLSEFGFVGGNITLPHKETAFRCLDNLDEAARKIGAVNTVWLDEKGKWQGSNTDAFGFAANLDDHAPGWRSGESALVLGAGGASRAVIHALVEAEYNKILIINRTVQKAESLARHFGSQCSFGEWDSFDDHIPGVDLVVNTTSLGMKGQEGFQLPDFSTAKQSAIVTDIVYTPLMTPLIRDAQMRGLATVDGLGMLLHQAVPGFEKWFGIRPRVTAALRSSILTRLA